MRKIWLILLASVLAAAAGELRTWTFSEDGEMRGLSGGKWSFRKNGRLDAAFIGVQGTNVIVVVNDGNRRIVPAKCLSEDDRAYLKQASGLSESQAAEIGQRVAATSAESKRKTEAARIRAEAATKRHVAQLDSDAAGRLENEAARLGSRANSLEAKADRRARFTDNVESSALVSPKESLAYVRAKGSTSLKTGAADRVEDDLVQLQHEAADKRAHADKLLREAADLENMALAIDSGAAPHAPASR
jgi:hypothetical protein